MREKVKGGEEKKGSKGAEEQMCSCLISIHADIVC